ncbi:hypothetical protein PENTCL1PPCAC_29543, partial [Pristionchus entomophagus]
KESTEYHDLLQLDIEESYRNMVYKIEGAYQWVRQNADSEFVVKVDSDTVVHIDRLYKRLKIYENTESGDWLACYKYAQQTAIGNPIRDKCTHWYIPDSDYSLDFLPDYCRGGGYAFKRKTFDKIVQRLNDHKVFEVEDMFFTGVVAGNLDVTFMEGVIPFEYTDYSECDSHGPSVSMLNTHNQFAGSTSKKNLKAAWARLKSPICR